jgi:hypothetical protein
VPYTPEPPAHSQADLQQLKAGRVQGSGGTSRVGSAVLTACKLLYWLHAPLKQLQCASPISSRMHVTSTPARRLTSRYVVQHDHVCCCPHVPRKTGARA